MSKKRILVVSYIETLLKARKDVLEEAGFFVAPAYGFAEATQICRVDHSFDLVILGPKIPPNDKIALVEFVKARCNAPILSIRNATDPPLRRAEFSMESTSEPEMLVVAVRLALEIDSAKPSSSASASSRGARPEV